MSVIAAASMRYQGNNMEEIEGMMGYEESYNEG
jgi:hypothetical protein